MRSRKRQRSRALVITIAVLGCLGIGMGMWLWQKPQTEPHKVQKNTEKKTEQEVQAVMNEDGTAEADVGKAVEEALSNMAEETP